MPRREIITPIGPSIAYVPLTQEKFALVDSADVEILKPHNWNAHKTQAHCGFYASAAIQDDEGRWRYKGMHAFIMGTTGKREIPDHRNGNGLDNRRANLRKTSPSGNQCNYFLRKSNTSGFRGVWPRGNKWVSAIKFAGVRQYLGTFETKYAAAEAYRVASVDMHGEFAHSFVRARYSSS